MCGILLTFNIEEGKFLEALKLIKHRGPFHHGYKSSHGVCIGMTQLPMKQDIQDNLPVQNENFYVAYNGELYGKDITSLSTEVETLLNHIEKKQAVDGMFAFVAWDKKNHQVIFGRDEFGIKPLYYFINEEKKQLIICSEILPILTMIGAVAPNQEVIGEILTLGTQASENTCFSRVKLLCPGALVKINLDNMSISRERLAAVRILSKDNLDTLLQEAISICHDSVREPALLLSEGLDSNLLLSYLPQDIPKFNILMEGAQAIQAEAYTHLVQCHLHKENFLTILAKAIKSYAQPCRMNSILMYQILSDTIKKHHVHLVMTGEGADEIFWGYPRHRQIYELSLKHSLDKKQVFDIFFGNLTAKIKVLQKPEHLYAVQDSLHRSNENLLEYIEMLDKHYSMEPLLRRTDHLLMQNAIEARVPYLHAGIPHFAKQLGFKRVNQQTTKYPLAQLMKDRVANFPIVPKQHFRAPINQWQLGLEHFFTEERIEIMSTLGIEINQFKAFRENNSASALFPFITLVIWYEEFKQYLHR